MVSPLAAAEIEQDQSDGDTPRIDLPDSLKGRIFLGFDEIQSSYLIHAQISPVVLGDQDMPRADDPLAALRRRWVAMMLSGAAAQRQSNQNSIAAETGQLGRIGFTTGAAILDSLSRSHSAEGPNRIDTFLATALYLRNCQYELAKARATFR